MLAALREIADEADELNPYLGSRRAADLRGQIAALPADVPDLRRWLFHRLLGRHELMLGNGADAIRNYEIAYSQLAVFADEIPADKALETVFDLGVAHMRVGETRNCVQHHTAQSCIFPIEGGGVHGIPEHSQAAIRYFIEVLNRTRPGSYHALKARWLVNIAYMTLGQYPAGVPDAYRIEPETFASDAAFPRFSDRASTLGLDTFDLAGGAVADDFDDDGWLDIVVTTSDTRGATRFFRNTGSGTFEERTLEAGLEGLWGGLNLTHGDYNNDGYPDLFILRGAWWSSFGRHPNSLLRNNGDGTFTDVTFDAGLGGVHYPTQTAAFADYDLDGDLDLYIGNEFDDETAAPCQLFRNNGDGSFTDVAESAGVRNERFAKAVSWGDYNDDRWPDLFVSNIGQANRLYRNNGDGTFTDVAVDVGVERPIASFPSWFWDFDNNGTLDLFVAGYGGPRMPPDVASVAASYIGLPHHAELARLYSGDGQGGFQDVAASHGLTDVTLPMGSNFGDLDNDGFLDFYLGTGYPFFEGLMPNVMYLNRRGAAFVDITTSGGFGHLQKGHGIVFADFDHDGDQDIFEQMGGFYPGDAFANALFENPGFDQAWIKLLLIGTQSNRSAIGARLKLTFHDGDAIREVHRRIGSGGSFGSNPFRQEIGLGAATHVATLEIYWPATAQTQRFVDLPVNRLVEITEGEEHLQIRELQAVTFGS